MHRQVNFAAKTVTLLKNLRFSCRSVKLVTRKLFVVRGFLKNTKLHNATPNMLHVQLKAMRHGHILQIYKTALNTEWNLLHQIQAVTKYLNLHTWPESGSLIPFCDLFHDSWSLRHKNIFTSILSYSLSPGWFFTTVSVHISKWHYTQTCL